MNIDFPLFLWVTSGKIVHRYPVTTSVTKVLKQSASDTMAEQLAYKASCSRSNRATTDLVCPIMAAIILKAAHFDEMIIISVGRGGVSP